MALFGAQQQKAACGEGVTRVEVGFIEARSVSVEVGGRRWEVWLRLYVSNRCTE